MKMKDLLSQMGEQSRKLQLNNDKTEYAVLLHIRGKIYAIRNIAIDPFNDTYNIILVPYVSEFSRNNFTSFDRIYYLNARKSLLTGMENSIKLVLVDGDDANYIPVGTIDLKEQTIHHASLQGEGTNELGILYQFK